MSELKLGICPTCGGNTITRPGTNDPVVVGPVVAAALRLIDTVGTTDYAGAIAGLSSAVDRYRKALNPESTPTPTPASGTPPPAAGPTSLP